MGIEALAKSGYDRATKTGTDTWRKMEVLSNKSSRNSKVFFGTCFLALPFLLLHRSHTLIGLTLMTLETCGISQFWQRLQLPRETSGMCSIGSQCIN
jgi:hypothetical protein